MLLAQKVTFLIHVKVQSTFGMVFLDILVLRQQNECQLFTLQSQYTSKDCHLTIYWKMVEVTFYRSLTLPILHVCYS